MDEGLKVKELTVSLVFESGAVAPQAVGIVRNSNCLASASSVLKETSGNKLLKSHY